MSARHLLLAVLLAAGLLGCPERSATNLSLHLRSAPPLGALAEADVPLTPAEP